MTTTETCPVCGMDVDPVTAPTASHHGTTYRFCSPACQHEFKADPKKFTGE